MSATAFCGWAVSRARAQRQKAFISKGSGGGHTKMPRSKPPPYTFAVPPEAARSQSATRRSPANAGRRRSTRGAWRRPAGAQSRICRRRSRPRSSSITSCNCLRIVLSATSNGVFIRPPLSLPLAVRVPVPNNPNFYAAGRAIKFDFGQTRKKLFDHFQKDYRRFRMFAARGNDQAFPLFAWGRTWDVPTRANQQKVLASHGSNIRCRSCAFPRHICLVLEAPRRHHKQRMREHRIRRPQEQHHQQQWMAHRGRG